MPFDDRLPFHRKNLSDGTGRRLAEARVRIGRSRKDVAVEAGIKPRTLARIERGHQVPRWPTLKRLCEVLALSDYAIAPRWSNDADYVLTDPELAPGNGLRALRLERGVTLAKLAAASGISVSTLSRFERGLLISRRLCGLFDEKAGPSLRPVDGPGVNCIPAALGCGSLEAMRAACLEAARKADDSAFGVRIR